MVRNLHDGMVARINFGGELSDPIQVENGVKQGDIDDPTLFAIYFAAMMQIAFRNHNGGIYIRYRTSGKLFNLRRFDAKSKVFISLIRDLLCADDCDLVSHTIGDMQNLINAFDSACDAFGLSINKKKT